MALLPKPTSDEIRAYAANHECGLITAVKAMRIDWYRRNLIRIREQTQPEWPCDALIADLCELLLLRMSDAPDS